MDNIKKQKPITLLRQEFLENFVALCNQSNLPMFCIESILRESIDKFHLAAMQQYEKDKQEYEGVKSDTERTE